MAIWTRPARYIKGLLVTQIWRMRGVRCADRVVVQGRSPHFSCAGNAVLGSRISFRTLSGLTRLSVSRGANLLIGNKCFINGNTIIHASIDVTIGDHCRIGEDVWINDRAYHSVDEHVAAQQSPISIGRNVWIANGATILPGVTLGDHCVVAARAVVSRSFPAKTLIAGVPARKLRDVVASDDWIRS